MLYHSRDRGNPKSAYPVTYSEEILERKLHLPHAPVGGRNAAEVNAAEAGIRQIPDRMIQRVKRFPTELQLVTLFRHAEDFVRREVETEPGRADDCVPACIAELINRLESVRSRVEPFLGSWIGQRFALAGRVRTIVPDVCIRAVHARGRVYRESGAPGHDGTELPSAGDSVHETVLDIHLPTFTQGQIVESRHHQAMAIIEGRQSTVAKHASAVLRKKSVAVGSANSAGSIDGLRPGVRHQSGHPIRVALGQLRSQGVVVTAAAV